MFSIGDPCLERSHLATVSAEISSEIAKSSKIGFRPLFFYKITAFLEKSDLSLPDHRRLFLTSSPYY